MASVTYNFVHPEEFNDFVPEALIEKRSQNAQKILLIFTAGIILAGIGYLYYHWWQDQQQKKESQIRRQ